MAFHDYQYSNGLWGYEGGRCYLALVVHTVQTLLITLVGFVAIILLPFANKRYRRLQTSETNT